MSWRRWKKRSSDTWWRNYGSKLKYILRWHYCWWYGWQVCWKGGSNNTLKLWHRKSQWKSRVTLKILGTKDMNKTDFPSARFKIFSVILVSLKQRKIFQCDYQYVESFVNIFQCGFRVFQCEIKFQCQVFLLGALTKIKSNRKCIPLRNERWTNII